MKLRSLFFLFLLLLAPLAWGEEIIELWQGLAPGETKRGEDIDSQDSGVPAEITTPRLMIFSPEQKKSTSCVLILPGGGYHRNFYHCEGLAQFWNQRGITAAILVYRVPRPLSGPIYQKGWEDVQRGVKLLRANADRLGIDPERIGVEGFSAGGHLSILAAGASQTPAYQPIDEIDQLPCYVAFAIGVYPAYLLSDGRDAQNANKGFGAELLIEDIHLDEKTPPVCLFHGDLDHHSPLGSVELYRKLHQMKIPCELHIYQGVPHAFWIHSPQPNLNSWEETSYHWLQSIGMN